MVLFAIEWYWHTCHLLVKGTLGQESRHVCAFQYMIMMQDDVYTLWYIKMPLSHNNSYFNGNSDRQTATPICITKEKI